jgi:hypothetical protein
MTPQQRLINAQTRATKKSLRSLRREAPRVYAFIQHNIAERRRAGIGAIDWGSFTTSIIGDLSMLKQSKEMAKDERRMAELKLKEIQLQNAAIEKQIQSQTALEEMKIKGNLMLGQQQLALADRMKMAGGSLLDQIKDKPWAIPALAGLSFMLIRSVTGRRR